MFLAGSFRHFVCGVFLIASLFTVQLNAKTIFIGIAGGTGSGKTTLANKICHEYCAGWRKLDRILRKKGCRIYLHY